MSNTVMTVFARLRHSYYVFLLITQHQGKLYTPHNIKRQKMIRMSIDRSKDYCSAASYGLFTAQLQAMGYLLLNYKLWVIYCSTTSYGLFHTHVRV
jgi:hypothetical protein